MADSILDIPDVDALFALVPAEFVAGRTAVVKRLRAEGDRSAATRVAALRRPTRVAWAVNQVSRQRREQVQQLLDAADALRASQDALIGGGDVDAFRQATQARRAALSALGDAIVEIAGESVRNEGVATLDAASTTDEGRDLLRRGVLTSEVEPSSSFGIGAPMESLTVQGPGESQPTTPTDPPNQLDVKRRQREVARAEEVLTRAEETLTAAETHLDRVRSDLEAANHALASARRARDAAAAALDKTKGR